MTVREVLNLLCLGAKWQLIGEKSGKKLCDSFNRKETQEKYMDMVVCERPIVLDFYVSQTTTMNYIKPIISVWVSGQ